MCVCVCAFHCVFSTYVLLGSSSSSSSRPQRDLLSSIYLCPPRTKADTTKAFDSLAISISCSHFFVTQKRTHFGFSLDSANKENIKCQDCVTVCITLPCADHKMCVCPPPQKKSVATSERSFQFQIVQRGHYIWDRQTDTCCMLDSMLSRNSIDRHKARPRG